jgi:hypothetical protein
MGGDGSPDSGLQQVQCRRCQGQPTLESGDDLTGGLLLPFIDDSCNLLVSNRTAVNPRCHDHRRIVLKDRISGLVPVFLRLLRTIRRTTGVGASSSLVHVLRRLLRTIRRTTVVGACSSLVHVLRRLLRTIRRTTVVGACSSLVHVLRRLLRTIRRTTAVQPSVEKARRLNVRRVRTVRPEAVTIRLTENVYHGTV